MVWKKKKAVQDGKKKKVSFADPIATELKAPRTTIQDDSILLIKGNDTAKNVLPSDGELQMDNCTRTHPLTHTEKEAKNVLAQVEQVHDNNKVANLKSAVTIATVKEGRQGLEAPIIEKEGLQHALNMTLKMMQMQLVMPSSSPVSILSHQAVDITEISIPRE
jgi:hypothetical protein